MKIVQAVHAFPPAIGGIESHAYNLSVHLASLGAQVVVHTSRCNGCEDADRQAAQKGVIVKRHFAISIPGFSSVKFIPFLPLILYFENADIYCSHGFGSPVPICASLAAIARGKPFFWTLHGMPKFGGLKNIFVKIYGIGAAIPFAAAKKIICVSEVVKNSLGEANRKKAEIIPNGISKKFVEYPDKRNAGRESEFRVLFAGRLDESKGIWMLIRAFSKFYANHPGAKLVFVGPDEGGNRAKLQKFADENKLPVEFETKRADEMAGAYSSANVCVLPSEYEGFGLCVFESWACGTPAISTATGAMPKFFEDAFDAESGKFIFNGQGGLLERLEGIYLMGEGEREKYAKKAKDALQQYSWARIASKTMALFEENLPQ